MLLLPPSKNCMLKMKKYMNRAVGASLMVMLLVASCGEPHQTTTEEEITPGIVLENMDTTQNPADDFFKFVNGNWLGSTEIPDDQGRWGSFNELREANNEVVLTVLETAAKSEAYGEGTDERKVADFYDSGMDSLRAEAAGVAPLQPYLDQIEGIQNMDDLQAYLSQQQVAGGNAFFNFGILPDLKNSKVMATYLFQSGLGLPDRDYYTKTDSRSKEIREKYELHVAKMLQFLDYNADDAAAAATKVVAMETLMAEAALTNVERRNIPLLYNKYAISDLADLSADFNWAQYLIDLGANDLDTIIVTQPKFMKAFNEVVSTYDIADWKHYLKWHAIDGAAPFLNNGVVQANFDFFGTELRGTKAMRPRWKRVLGQTNGALGEALGKLYVSEAFPPEAKANAEEMVDNILAAFGDRIRGLEWMSDSTKEKALAKLSTFTVKIGYPDTWRDYSELVIEKPEVEQSNDAFGSYFNNVVNANKFEFKRQLSKLGKPVDREEWQMNPQTVNAYYNPLFNEIVFPAAILQPPFYNYKADAAVNYGGIGAVIGHEISHGFDDQGSRFDAEGNMNNWWSETDAEQFKARTGKLVSQYADYSPLDSVFVNGELTLGENIGDLGGISVALDGLKRHLATKGDDGLIDGYSQEQRFFISWATIWRIKYRDETLRTQINTDPHSPGMYRANGPISNMTSFYEAFDVKEGDGMHRPDSLRVQIW